MKIPYRYTLDQLDHVATPTKLGFIIPDVIGAFKSEVRPQNYIEKLFDTPPVITCINDSNRTEIQKLARRKRLMVVHCKYRADEDTRITLASTTVLWDSTSNHRKKLIYVDGIEIEPSMSWLSEGETINFTLYFEPLPKICKSFFLIEHTYEFFSFAAYDIKRVNSNEYWVGLKCFPY